MGKQTRPGACRRDGGYVQRVGRACQNGKVSQRRQRWRSHTPGFHAEAVEFLLSERDVKGIVVDTLSLDRGLSGDFPVHTRWLGSNRWGLECAANLGELPPKGSTLVVGSPKIAGASGGPSRVFALL